MVKRELKTWLIANAKDGKFRLLSPKMTAKQLKSRLKSTEIPINLTLNVDFPEQPIMKAHGEIKLSQTEINNFILSEIEEDEGEVAQ
jgi:hypothetical protein